MAASSSYIIGNRYFKDEGCFASLNSSLEDNLVIIIEKNKQFYHYNTIYSYLKDLREMGFNYNSVYRKRNGSIAIDVSMSNLTADQPKGKKIAFGMLVRYLWEGKYTNCQDKFFRIFDTYRELKTILPKHNKLELICLAHTLSFLKHDWGWGANSNHMLCYYEPNKGCLIKSSLDNIGNSVNNFFSRTTTIDEDIKSLISKPKITKKEYIKILNYLKI